MRSEHSKASERVNQIVSPVFSQLRQIAVYTEKSLEIPRRGSPLCQSAAGLCAHRKPQVIFHLSTCGILHVLVMAAAAFIVCAGSTNDDSVVNLDHDVTDPAPARQRRAGGARSLRCRPTKMGFPAALQRRADVKS